jgi:hypothetical protein
MEASDADNSDAENAALMEHLERTIPPMDLGDAERLLREVKEIFDEQHVVFFLRQGTCLGAVRDHALIAWDDDLDLGSIIDMHGFTVDAIAPAVEALRANGCYVEVLHDGLYTAVKIMKYRIRIDWQCYRVVKGTIAHYPGVPFPVSLFREGCPGQHAGGHRPRPCRVVETVPGRSVLAGPNRAAVGARRQRRTGRRRGGADRWTESVQDESQGLREVLSARTRMYVYRPDPAKAAGRYFVLTEE